MPPDLPPPDGAAVVVPVRSFEVGMARLADRLDPAGRAELARRKAERVVAAAGARPVAVVTSAPEVVEWAHGLGLTVLPDPGSLDGAAHAGRDWAARSGRERVVVVHGDLPFATSLDVVAGDGVAPVAVLVPCHRGDGTPALSVPVTAPFAFAYGAGSFQRHVAAARRAALTVRVVHDPDLAFDVDLPEDLDRLASIEPSERR